MNIRIQDGLPYVSVCLTQQGKSLTLDTVLLDTGAAGTVSSADKLLQIGLQLEPQDMVRRIQGVGGSEFVFMKQLDELRSGDLLVRDFHTEVGAMKYWLELDGILGMDFLLQVDSIIDLPQRQLYRKTH